MPVDQSSASICQKAMDLLRQSQVIVDIEVANPQTDAESICRRWYDPSRRFLIRSHIWNFTKKRRLIPRVETPAFGFTDAYQLPNDFIRLNIVGADAGTYSLYYRRNYAIEDGKILVNASGANSIPIIYQYDFTRVSKMDSMFTLALAAQIAYFLAHKFSGDNKNTQRIKAILDEAVEMAKSADGQEQPPVSIEVSQWNNARRRSSLSSYAGPIQVWDD